MLVVKRIVFDDVAERLALAPGDVAQAVGDLLDRRQIDRNLEPAAADLRVNHSVGGMGRAVGQRRGRGVNHIDPGSTARQAV